MEAFLFYAHKKEVNKRAIPKFNKNKESALIKKETSKNPKKPVKQNDGNKNKENLKNKTAKNRSKRIKQEIDNDCKENLKDKGESGNYPPLKRFKNDADDDSEKLQETELLSECSGASAYERMIAKNIEERKKFLKELNINEAKNELEESLPVKKPKTLNLSYKSPKNKPDLPKERRRSQRLQNVKAPTHFEVATIEYNDSLERELSDPGPCELQSYYELENEAESSLFVNNLKGINAKSSCLWPNDKKSLSRVFASMVCTENMVAKVVPNRIFSIKVHPTTEKNLIFVGGKRGELGIWDFKSREEDNIFYYNIHSKPINCMSVDVFDHSNLLTNSYDGSLRKLDLNSTIVEQLYICDDRFYTSWHAQTDPHCFLISGSSGFVDMIDTRVSKEPVNHFTLHNNRSVKLVTVYPKERNLMATGGADGCACLWDLRKMKRTPLSMLHHGRALSGLEFSSSGSSLLSTSADDHLRIMTLEDKTLAVKTKIRHNNNTGRWLTTFRASWIPGSDDHFVVGSMRYPRVIEIWDSEGSLSHAFMDEHSQSVCSVNSFHPQKRLLAGGNSSGKVYVFSSELNL